MTKKLNLHIDVCEKYLAGKSGPMLAKEYGCSSLTIYRFLRKYNIRIRKRSETILINKIGWIKNILPIKICEEYITGKSMSILAEDYGCSPGTISKFLQIHDVKIRTLSESALGHKCSDETRRKKSIALSGRYLGENSSNWKGGISNGNYCSLFNKSFKIKVRNSYNNKCFICSKTKQENRRNLDVHHVNYDKACLCGSPCDFIPLCRSCHSKTNFNRKYWEDLIMHYLYPERYFIVDI